jgi:hypothetical protein
MYPNVNGIPTPSKISLKEREKIPSFIQKNNQIYLLNRGPPKHADIPIFYKMDRNR